MFAQSVKNIKFMTENYPPFNFQENGKLQGISVDLITATMKRIDPSFDQSRIELLPWARGYKIVQEKKNTCLFAMTRTAARENLFKWAGPLAPALIVLTAKKSSHIKINSIEDLKKYNIGTIIKDVGEQLLNEKGIPNSKLDRIGGTDAIDISIKKLDKGRIDLFSYDSNVLKWKLKQNGLNPDDYETVYVLKKGKLSYAFNKNTPDKIVNQIQKVIDEVKKDGTYQKILDKYLK
jgi:polar amino acid transport system substrate-binding protein